MTESRLWVCWICSESQETIDRPKMQVCEDCLRPVAEAQCKAALGVPLATEGVDRGHWMRLAAGTVQPMMARWAT